MTVQNYLNLGVPKILMAAASGPSYNSNPGPTLTTQTANGSPTDSKNLPISWQFLIYGIFLAAVIASRFIDFYTSAIPGNVFVIDRQYLIFAAIVSLAAFPVVYDKAIGCRSSPYMVQVALVFTTGLGWEKLLSTLAYFSHRA